MAWATHGFGSDVPSVPIARADDEMRQGFQVYSCT